VMSLLRNFAQIQRSKFFSPPFCRRSFNFLELPPLPTAECFGLRHRLEHDVCGAIDLDRNAASDNNLSSHRDFLPEKVAYDQGAMVHVWAAVHLRRLESN